MDVVENTLINLRVIKSLQCHDRLDTTDPLFKIHTTHNWIPTWMKRWWAAQTRRTDISRVHTLYQQAAHFISVNHREKERIADYLRSSRSGLVNLKTTYENDPTVLAQIDVILDKITAVVGSDDFLEQTSD